MARRSSGADRGFRGGGRRYWQRAVDVKHEFGGREHYDRSRGVY